MRYSGEKIRISMTIKEFNGHINDLQSYIENLKSDKTYEDVIKDVTRIKEVMLQYSILEDLDWTVQNGKILPTYDTVRVVLFDRELDILIRLECYRDVIKSEPKDYTDLLIEKQARFIKQRYKTGVHIKEESEKYFKDLPPYTGKYSKKGRKTKSQIMEILGVSATRYKDGIAIAEAGYPEKLRLYEEIHGEIVL